MKTNYLNLVIESHFKGDKLAPWSGDDRQQNWNNHTVRVVNTETKRRVSFDFWGSIMNPVIGTEAEVLQAFEMFVSDALSGDMSFNNFCDEFGYDVDSRKAERIYKACGRALVKFRKIVDSDLYDFANTLRDKVNA